MKQNKYFKIYVNNKLNIKDQIAKEIRFRAGLIADMSVEIGKCVLDDFISVR